jgi:inositol phosphorylceramide mannosyltransferase catalytic subunit
MKKVMYYTYDAGAISNKAMLRNIFHWECSDSCACLPPIVNKEEFAVTMHQSYKSSDMQTWHVGWKFHHQTWLDLHPDWYFIFWTDDQNELLAKCIGYHDIFNQRSSIQKADLSRLMYLHKYGGFYADMDYIAVQNHASIFQSRDFTLKQQQILFQGRQEQVAGLEWGFARKPEHPFWKFCLDIADRQDDEVRAGCPIKVTGPKLIRKCIKKYFHLHHNDLEHMVSYGGELMILEPRLISPIGAFDFSSECGKWRNITGIEQNERKVWSDMWMKSKCKENLIKNGTYAVTIYSHSWGTGLGC